MSEMRLGHWWRTHERTGAVGGVTDGADDPEDEGVSEWEPDGVESGGGLGDADGLGTGDKLRTAKFSHPYKLGIRYILVQSRHTGSPFPRLTGGFKGKPAVSRLALVQLSGTGRLCLSSPLPIICLCALDRG